MMDYDWVKAGVKKTGGFSKQERSHNSAHN